MQTAERAAPPPTPSLSMKEVYLLVQELGPDGWVSGMVHFQRLTRCSQGPQVVAVMSALSPCLSTACSKSQKAAYTLIWSLTFETVSEGTPPNRLDLVARGTEACVPQDCTHLHRPNVLKPRRSALHTNMESSPSQTIWGGGEGEGMLPFVQKRRE